CGASGRAVEGSLCRFCPVFLSLCPLCSSLSDLCVTVPLCFSVPSVFFPQCPLCYRPSLFLFALCVLPSVTSVLPSLFVSQCPLCSSLCDLCVTVPLVFLFSAPSA